MSCQDTERHKQGKSTLCYLLQEGNTGCCNRQAPPPTLKPWLMNETKVSARPSHVRLHAAVILINLI